MIYLSVCLNDLFVCLTQLSICLPRGPVCLPRWSICLSASMIYLSVCLDDLLRSFCLLFSVHSFLRSILLSCFFLLYSSTCKTQNNNVMLSYLKASKCLVSYFPCLEVMPRDQTRFVLQQQYYFVMFAWDCGPNFCIHSGRLHFFFKLLYVASPQHITYVRTS